MVGWFSGPQTSDKEMSSWLVYKHISPSGKVYVGITSNVKRRWAASGYYYHLSDTAFSNALKKYGWNNFQHIIVQENLSKEEACDMEKELIAYYKAKKISYNITDGGDGTFGFKPTKKQIDSRVASRVANNTVDYLVIDKSYNYIICETEKEVAEYLGEVQRNVSHVLNQPIGYTFKKCYIWKHQKGTPVNIKDIIAQIEAALQRRKQRMSEHTKSISDKMVAGFKAEREALTATEKAARYHKKHKKGWHHSEETRKKMSEKAKGRDMTKVHKARQQTLFNPTHTKPVIQYLTTGELVKEYLSITQASKETGVSTSNIHSCLSGRSKTSGGYYWQYKN